MRKFLSLVLAIMMVASVAVIAVSAADTDAAAAGAATATITLYNVKGESVTQTYAVGETFTAYTYLNVSGTGDSKCASINGSQEFNTSVLELADAYDSDPESFDYGLIDDVTGMLPICGTGAIANAGHPGVVYYNASNARGFKYDSDNCALIITHYTVKAAGTADITNKMQTLALSDDKLTRVIDRGQIKVSTFNSPVVLSEPAEQPAGSTVSGTVTSYLSDTDEITVELLQDDAVVYTTTTTGKSAAYSIADVADGTYTLRVSKKDHVTRDYAEIAVSGDTTADAKICPLGDISGDGKVTTKDYAMANAHAQKVTFQTGYALKCGDVLKGDGKITTADAARINSAAQKVDPLW